MNYYSAREIIKDGKASGKYRYTCQNDGNVWSVGYCSGWDSCPDCREKYPADAGCKLCKGKGLVEAANPCHGHDTKEEAESHYKEYLLDKRLRIDGPKKEEWPKHKCGIWDCNEEGRYLATLGMECYELCEKHANRESVSTLLHVGECWSSY